MLTARGTGSLLSSGSVLHERDRFAGGALLGEDAGYEQSQLRD